MKTRWSTVRDSLKKDHKVDPGKEVDLSKEDYIALCKAAYSTFFPAILAVLLFFAVIIFLITLLWSSI